MVGTLKNSEQPISRREVAVQFRSYGPQAMSVLYLLSQFYWVAYK